MRINPAFTERLSKLPEEKKQEVANLKKACSDFESIFMHQMLKEMNKTIDKSGLIHGGQAEEIFSDMLDQERAANMSVGIGDMLFMQLAKSYVPPVNAR